MAATVPMSNNNVQFSTYLSWKLGDSFDVDVVEIENRRIVKKFTASSAESTPTKFVWTAG